MAYLRSDPVAGMLCRSFCSAGINTLSCSLCLPDLSPCLGLHGTRAHFPTGSIRMQRASLRGSCAESLSRFSLFNYTIKIKVA